MLVIKRLQGSIICIGDEIEIHILASNSTRVRLGIKAPKHITIKDKVNESPKKDPGVFDPLAIAKQSLKGLGLT